MSAEAGVIPVGMVLVDADGLLSIEQLAEYTGISKNTLYYWRVEGRGPRGMKLGKYVRYRRADVEAWLDDSLDDRRSARHPVSGVREAVGVGASGPAARTSRLSV